MLGQIGVANIKIAEKRELQNEYTLRIRVVEGTVARKISWVNLERPTSNSEDVDLYGGLYTIRDWSYHDSGYFHLKAASLKNPDRPGGMSSVVLVSPMWKRQRLQQMGSSELISAFILRLDTKDLGAFPTFEPNKEYSDIVTIDLNAFATRPNSVTVKLTAARKGNFFEPIPESPYFRRIFEFEPEKLWLIISVERN